MEFNYALEKKKFDREWIRLRKAYEDAGMSGEAIRKMWEFDYEQFKKQRVFCLHNQYLDTEVDGIADTEESMNPLMKKYADSFTVKPKEVSGEDRFGWLEEIDNPALYEVIHGLKEADIELLTMLAIEGFSKKEIADYYGISKAAVSQKIARIKNILKNFS